MTTDDQTQPVGQRIQAHRTARGWSQADLADRLHVTQTAVSYWESGKRQLTAEALVHVAHALGIETAELLPASEPANPEEWPPDDQTQLDRIEARLDRLLDLLEARHGGIAEAPEDGRSVNTDGCVIQGSQRPESGIVVTFDPPKPGAQAAAEAAASATIAALRRQRRLRG